MKLHTKTLLVSLTASALVAGTADAANVLFVDDETPDSSWQNLITGGGHSYTLFDTGSFSLSLGDQASIDYVESFDVAIISGSNPNFNAVRSHGATWNTLSTPLVNMGNFLAAGAFSAGSWNWTTPSTAGASNAGDASDVLDPGDLVWTGVTFDTQGPPPTIDLFSGNAGHLNLEGDSLLAGITATAALSSNTDFIAVAHAAPDALRAGSQEQYFIAGMTGGSGNPVAFTAEGEKVFLNTIGVLSGEVVPEPGSLALLGLGGLLIARRRRG